MKVVIVIALLLVLAGCKQETPTMMSRCYNCDTPAITQPEVNLELEPAKKQLQPWQNPSQQYLALG
jgi:hypothetical protein